MAVPKYDELMLPLLKIAADGQEHKLIDVVPIIATALKLSESDLAEQIPSGQSRLRNRVYWAKLYLSQAGCLNTVKPGVFQISERGRDLLKEAPLSISPKLLTRYPEFIAFLNKSKAGSSSSSGSMSTGTLQSDESATPQESLHAAYNELRTAVERDLLDSVQAAPPAFLESLVVRLLSAMGYGSDEGAGVVLGGVHDGGVDGVVRKDRLGLGSIYIQAKRYQDGSSVGAPSIQQFAGSMQERKADEGVFVTTSTFTKEARESASKLHVRIALIDGARLAELMFELGIGVTTESTLTIKRLDAGFFPET
jgi:restriction system protein